MSSEKKRIKRKNESSNIQLLQSHRMPRLSQQQYPGCSLPFFDFKTDAASQEDLKTWVITSKWILFLMVSGMFQALISKAPKLQSPEFRSKLGRSCFHKGYSLGWRLSVTMPRGMVEVVENKKSVCLSLLTVYLYINKTHPQFVVKRI